MRRWKAALNLAAAISLAACASGTASPPPPTPAATLAATQPATAPGPQSDDAYTSLTVPLIQRSAEPQAGVDSTGPAAFALHTGDFHLELGGSHTGLRLTGPGPAALAIQPFGPALDALAQVDSVAPVDDPDRPGVVVAGSNTWMSYRLWVWVYPHNPGLLRYHLELTRSGDVPNGSVEPEWLYVDPATGEETAADYTAYADRSSFASPSFFGYSAALGASLLHWVDLTRLNPFIEAHGLLPGHYPRAPGPPLRPRSLGQRAHRPARRRRPHRLRQLPVFDPRRAGR